MKNLIKIVGLIALFALIVPRVNAQDFAGTIGATVTHTNAQADTISVTIAKARPSIAFKYNITKTSGTVAGTIVLQGRITPVSNTKEQWTTVNSYTLTDATANNVVALTSNNYIYYRVITTTSGTSVTVHDKQLLYRGY